MVSVMEVMENETLREYNFNANWQISRSLIGTHKAFDN